MLDQSSTIGIVGAGTMGSGLAVSFANHGCQVTLYDVDRDALEHADSTIEMAFDVLTDAGFVDPDDRDGLRENVRMTDSLRDVATDADAVVEAASEDLALKRELFGRLDEYVDDETILATNTSGLSITEIATAVDDPGRLLGTHWFNPPYVVPLVELIYGAETTDETVETVYEFIDSMGKTPIVVRKDVPGFIANRIQLAMDYEAWSLLERGVASAEDIDRAVKAGFGFVSPPSGCSRRLTSEDWTCSKRSKPTSCQRPWTGEPSQTSVSANWSKTDTFGLKSGEGVYDWSDRRPEQAARWRDEQLLEVLALYDRL